MVCLMLMLSLDFMKDSTDIRASGSANVAALSDAKLFLVIRQELDLKLDVVRRRP